MAPRKRKQRRSDLETNVAPDALPEDPRRADVPQAVDPGDVAPSDYERELDRLDAAARSGG